MRIPCVRMLYKGSCTEPWVSRCGILEVAACSTPSTALAWQATEPVRVDGS